MYRQDFQVERKEGGYKPKHASHTNRTWRESDIQNERKVKSYVATCKLI